MMPYAGQETLDPADEALGIVRRIWYQRLIPVAQHLICGQYPYSFSWTVQILFPMRPGITLTPKTKAVECPLYTM